MNKNVKNRREFLKLASLSAFSLPLLLNCRSSTLAQRGGGTADEDILSLIKKNAKPRGTEGMGAIEAPSSLKNISWQTDLTRRDEPGEPILISGTVYQPDGRTPAPNMLIYFYHTDTEGIYGRAGEPKHGRYRGWLLTDRKGRYEFRSIRPASYPNSRNPQHIHMTLTGENFKEDWIDSILFEGDEFITPRMRETAGRKGGFDPIIKLKKETGGIFYGRRDIQLPKI